MKMGYSVSASSRALCKAGLSWRRSPFLNHKTDLSIFLATGNLVLQPISINLPSDLLAWRHVTSNWWRKEAATHLLGLKGGARAPIAGNKPASAPPLLTSVHPTMASMAPAAVGGQKIKGGRWTVFRFALLSIAYTSVWLAVSSQLGWYRHLHGPQVLLQLNLAYFLPSIPLLVVSAYLDRPLEARFGKRRCVGRRGARSRPAAARPAAATQPICWPALQALRELSLPAWSLAWSAMELCAPGFPSSHRRFGTSWARR